MSHYLIKPCELIALEKLAVAFRKARNGSGKVQHQFEAFEQLSQFAQQVIARELGAEVFEGVSVRWLERAVELA